MAKYKLDAKSIFSDIGLFYAAAIWGSTFFVVKNSLDMIDPVALVGYRFIFASLIIAIPLIFLKRRLFYDFRKGAILGLLLWLLYISQTIGLNYTTASNSGFITGLFIIFLPLFSFFMHRSVPGLSKIVSLCIASAGLWFLTGGIDGINFGDVLTIIAAMTYALHILFADRFIKKDIDPYVLSFQQFLTVGVLSFISGFLFRLPMGFPEKGVLPAVIFLTVFPTVSAFVIQLVCQKHSSPIKVGLIFTMEPVFAAIFSWTIGGEGFVMHKAFGGLLIVIAMILSEIPWEKMSKKSRRRIDG